MNRSTIEAKFQSLNAELDKLTTFYRASDRAIIVCDVSPRYYSSLDDDGDKPRLVADLTVYMQYEDRGAPRTVHVDGKPEGTVSSVEVDRYYDSASLDDLNASELVTFAALKEIVERWNQNELDALPASNIHDPRGQRPSRRTRRIRR